MNTGIARAILALALCLSAAGTKGQNSTALRLEPPGVAAAPFQKGDCLDIQAYRSPAPLRIIILDAKSWPWVFAKSADGEVWINFTNILKVKRVVEGPPHPVPPAP
jgi:hypothetical protein